MLKIRNQSVIGDIAKTTYRANKKRNLLVITAIFLTTFLISVILSLGLGYFKTISLRQIRMYGMDYDIALSEPTEEQVDIVRSMESVKHAGVSVKCAVVSSYEEKELDKLRLYWVDDICWKKQTLPALESYTGTYPKRENEIFLSTNALRDMGITTPSIGMKLSLSYDTLKLKKETSVDTHYKKTFTLCGWYQDYSGKSYGYISKQFYKNTGVKQTDLTQGELKISLKNSLYSEQDIIDMQNSIGLTRNQYIDADYDTISSFCKITIGLFLLLCMVFLSGYLFINNTMYISVSKDIRYYGQLKTLGMTSIQLRRLIYIQIFFNSLLGIPLGLFGAAIVSNGIVPKMLHIVNPTISAKDVASTPFWVLLLAGAFAFMTAIISSHKPVKMAKDCSPIEAIAFITISKNKINKQSENGSMYTMAKQNIFRDKKQAFIILLSLSTAVSLFLVVNTIIYENDAKLILNTISAHDMQILNQSMLEEEIHESITEEMIAKIKKIDGVKEVGKIMTTVAIVPYQEQVYGEYYKKLYESRFTPGNYQEDMALYKKNPADSRFSCRFVAMNEYEFTKMNDEMGNTISPKDFKEGKIALSAPVFYVKGENGIPQKTVKFYLPFSKTPEKEHSILIEAIASKDPAYFAGGYTPDIIVSEAYAKKLLGDTITELINIKYETPFSAKIEEEIKKVIEGEKWISYESKLERYDQMKQAENQIKVFGISMGVIVLLLAVLNYVNMMAASIQNRSKEFAILESIGMTRKQLQKMVVFEGLGYGIFSLVLANILGIPLSYGVFQGLNEYRLPFAIPWLYNIILYTAILMFCIMVPIIMLRKIHQYSIIEQLREIDR